MSNVRTRLRSLLNRATTPVRRVESLPASILMALEPRLMFDGAALSAVDPTSGKAVESAASSGAVPRTAWGEAEPSAAAIRAAAEQKTAASPVREVVFVDPSVPDLGRLIGGLRAGVEVVVLDPARDGLAQIASVVASGGGPIGVLHLISHGAAGQLMLGGRVLDAASLDGYRSALGDIGVSLTADADILLYGCDIGQGAPGAAFLQALADATGADMAASTDPTGSARFGGNWTLEAAVGRIDASGALADVATLDWQHVLTEIPGVALSVASPSVTPGDAFTITATFDNIGYVTGYGPYIDLFVPARSGADSGAPDDVTIVGASHLGIGLTVTQIVLTQADIDAGTVEHPYARDGSGGNRVDVPGGFVAGDRLVVIELPFASYTVDEPASRIAIETVLSPSADVGTPLEFVASSGFRYGADPLDNPDVDPSSLSSIVALTIQPSLASVTTRLVGLDKVVVGTSEPAGTTAGLDVVIGERVTYEATVRVPQGTITGARFVDTLDPGLSFVSIDAITTSAGVTIAGGAPAPGSVVPGAAGGDANRITIPFGTITNSNADSSAIETVTVRYTVVVSNVAANQQGQQLDNVAHLESSEASASRVAPALRVVEPSVSMALVPSVPRADAGDLVGYELTITAHAGSPPAFDVDLAVANLVPTGLSYEPGSLQIVSAPGGGTAAFGGDGIVGNWARLDAGQQIVLRFDARVTDSTTLGDTFDQTATLRFSSLPGTGNTALSPFTAVGDFERTGTSTDPGASLNDYRVVASAPVTVASQTPVLTLVASSEPGSAGATVVPGEVVRFRMVVQVPEGAAVDAQIVPTLPAGLRFVNDGSATIAFVANGGGAGVDSSTLAGSAYDALGGGADAPSIVGIAPTLPVPGTAIVDALGAAIPGGTVMAAGTAPRFVLGDLTNADRDADKEFVVVEFNAIVDNAAAGSTGASGSVRFDWRTDGVSRALSNVVGVTVGEPSIVDLDKRVVAVSGSQVTFEATFTNTGNQTAYDVRLVDAFAGAVNLAFAGAGSVTGIPAGGSNASDASGVDVRLPSLAAGASVSIRYVATVANLAQTVPARDAVVTYTSLSTGGVALATATSAGAILTPTTGERTGSTSDYGAAVNVYRDTDPAGLGALSGQLWDDTATPDGAIGAGEPRLAGVTVTLTHAGSDGAFGTADDLSFTTATDAAGAYAFGAVPEGAVRITAPTVIANANGSLGEVRARVDVQGSPTDATIALTVASGVAYADRDIGYVQRNDAPTVAVPGPQTVAEDVPVPIGGVAIADPDGGASTAHRVTLSVGTGTLAVVPSGTVAATGVGSRAVTLTGSVADLNATLATLVYRGAINAGGSDTLMVRVDDRGNAGDADGDGLPSEPVDDNLFAQRTVPITVIGINDAPSARPDARTITEDQCVADGAAIAGNAVGDVADIDLDGDVRTVTGVSAGIATGPLTGGVGAPIVTPLGILTLQADGAYTYRPSIDLPAGRSVQDRFTYTIADPSGATSTATITITITGVDDAPVAVPDANRVRAGGVGTTSGNVVADGAPSDGPDRDADAGDVLSVRGVVAGSATGAIAAGVGAPVAGAHGTVVIGPDGRYTYRLDQADAAVRALRPGQTLIDTFSYTISDASGATATTTLTITIEGNELPTASSSTQVVDQGRPPGAPPPSVVPPTVADAETPTPNLTVRIDAIVRPEAGAFVRPDVTPVRPGDAMSVTDLQALLFVPNPGYVAPPSADGTLPGGALAYTVTDPSGGSAAGSIAVAVRPTAPLPAPAFPAPGPLATSSTLPLLALVSGGAPDAGSGSAADAPLARFFDPALPGQGLPSGPGSAVSGPGPSPVADTVRAIAGGPGAAGGPIASEASMLQPYALGPLAAPLALGTVPGEYVRQAVAEAREAMSSDRFRLDADSGRLDLDAGGMFPSNRVDGLFGEERIGPTRDWTPLQAAAVAAAPVVAAPPAAVAGAVERTLGPADDCEPPPKPKPKPVKRILPESLARPAPSFSEQLSVQKKKFRAPANVVPKAPPARQC
ncbi:MAG: DUF4347 domain-containing protein [Burkholderiales bacterium]|nr:DUF4347 domain-containing protein [Burkholderiales bacterium]